MKTRVFAVIEHNSEYITDKVFHSSLLYFIYFAGIKFYTQTDQSF